MGELENLRADLESLKVNYRQLEIRLRLAEDKLDTFVETRWWKKAWFVLNGYPLTRLVEKPQWRPWHCEDWRRRKARVKGVLTRRPCGGCGGD